jgi:hypothetical protein
MATWIAPIDTETDPDAPLLSSLGKRWDNNVIAAFEGDVGAPLSAAAWHPYDGSTVGGGNDGLIYDNAVDGNVGTVETPFFEDGYEYRLLCLEVVASSTGNWTVDLYALATGAWIGATTTSVSLNALTAHAAIITFYEPRRSDNAHVVSGFISNNTGSNRSDLGGAVITGSSGKIRNARIDPSGLMSGGRIYLHRRKVEDGT